MNNSNWILLGGGVDSDLWDTFRAKIMELGNQVG